MTKRPYLLDDTEEITILLLRIKHLQHLVLFGAVPHDWAVKKIRKMKTRIEALDGNPDAQIQVI